MLIYQYGEWYKEFNQQTKRQNLSTVLIASRFLFAALATSLRWQAIRTQWLFCAGSSDFHFSLSELLNFLVFVH